MNFPVQKILRQHHGALRGDCDGLAVVFHPALFAGAVDGQRALFVFGSCAENAMSAWISSYMENALHIDKALGDILGVAMFAILLALTVLRRVRKGDESHA